MAGRKALIIANDRYEQENLPDLASPAADAEALSKVLGDPAIGDFSVQVAQNELSHQIAARIEGMLYECQPDDLLLLHFSGHGLKSESGDLFFAAPNTRSNLLGSTVVSATINRRYDDCAKWRRRQKFSCRSQGSRTSPCPTSA